MANVYTPRTWEADAMGSAVQGHPPLHIRFKIILSNVKSCDKVHLSISVQQPLALVYISETFSESAMDMCVLFDTVSDSPTGNSLLPTKREN